MPAVVGATVGVLFLLAVKKLGEKTKRASERDAITLADNLIDGLVLRPASRLAPSKGFCSQLS